jgi:hypothetical protein
MQRFLMTPVRTLTVLFLAAALVAPQAALATQQVVTPAELHQRLVQAGQARQQNLERVERVFASPAAQPALAATGMDAKSFRQAAATLSDAELERLAQRAAQAERDFAAGQLTSQQITYILIALVTAVVILIIVVA